MLTNGVRAESLARWSAWGCLLIGIVLWLGPSLVRHDLFPNDAAHHVFWLYRYADPTLFPDDLSVEYFSSHSVAPIGYRALYACLAPWVDVFRAAEWISVLLLGSSGLLAWALGRALKTSDRDLMGLLAVAALMMLLPLVDLHPAMGFQRTFAMPATLLCLWALVAGRYRWVGVSWVTAALVYPVIIPVLGLAAAFVFLTELIRKRRLPTSWVWNGVLGVTTLLIVLLGSGTPEGIGPMVGFEQAVLMPEFGPGGRQQLFGSGIAGYWFKHHRTGLGWSPWAVLALAGSLALIQLRGKACMVPPAAWILALTGLVLWFAARHMLFDLYLPNRHSRWSLAAFAVVIFALAAYSIITWLARAERTEPARGPGWVRAFAFTAPLVVAGTLAPSAYANLKKPVDADMEQAYRFLGSLPRDTLVVAHPDVADFVPVRSKRSVLASTEAAIAFMVGYYAEYRPRLEDSLRIAYATSWQELDSIAAKYSADVVLTGPQVWSSMHYDAGFEDLMGELEQRGAREGFILRNPPPGRVLFRRGDVYVIRVDIANTGDGDAAAGR